MLRVAPHGVAERVACGDLAREGFQQVLHTDLVLAFGGDVQRLDNRQACLEHGGEFAHHECDIHRLDCAALTATWPRGAYPDGRNAVTLQFRANVRGADVAPRTLEQPSVARPAFPGIGPFGHVNPRLCRLRSRG